MALTTGSLLSFGGIAFSILICSVWFSLLLDVFSASLFCWFSKTCSSSSSTSSSSLFSSFLTIVTTVLFVCKIVPSSKGFLSLSTELTAMLFLSSISVILFGFTLLSTCSFSVKPLFLLVFNELFIVEEFLSLFS